MASKKLSIRFINKPGNIIRVALLLERRSYNIKSLHIYPLNDDSGYSEMYLEVKGEDTKFDQIKKQLGKLIDVISVEDAHHAPEELVSVYTKAAAGR